MAETITVTQNRDVVTERSSADWTDLWKKEDYWAIWLGFIILIAGLIVFYRQSPKI